MDNTKVTQRDIDTAIEMGAPQDVIDSLQRGEWPTPNTRYAIRYVEVAVDHMEETYGMDFRGYGALVPAWLDKQAVVDLVVVGGPYDGVTCQVRFNGYDENPADFEDNLWSACNRPAFQAAAADAVSSALAQLDPGLYVVDSGISDTWSAFLDPSTPFEEVGTGAHGTVCVYVSPEAGLAEADAQEAVLAIARALKPLGTYVNCFVDVVSSAPEEGPMTLEFVHEAAQRGGLYLFQTAADANRYFEVEGYDVPNV